MEAWLNMGYIFGIFWKLSFQSFVCVKYFVIGVSNKPISSDTFVKEFDVNVDNKTRYSGWIVFLLKKY